MSHRRHSPFLILDALFEGGRLFVGATSAAYLLSRGLSLSDLALLKSLQAGLLILFEIPTGIFADVYGRKLSLLLSLVCGLVGFSLYYFSAHLSGFLAAESLVALSLCFWSGAYEAYVIDAAKLESEPEGMDRFFHFSQTLNSGAVLLFGYAGGFLGKGGLGLPYLGAAGIFILAIFALLPLPETHSHKSAAPVALKERARTAIQQGLFSRKLAPFFWANVAIQFAIQPLLHFWQPFFQHFGESVTSETLGRIFVAYCATNMIFGALAARFSRRKFFRSQAFCLAIFASFGLSYFAVGFSPVLIPAVLFFCLTQGLLSVGRTSLSVRANQAMQGLPRATMLSALSFVSRFGMMAALGVLSLASKGGAPAALPGHLYVGFGAFTVVSVVLASLAWTFWARIFAARPSTLPAVA